MYATKTFTKAKKSVLCAEYPPMSSKFHLSKLKTYFSQFIDKFLKLELWGSGMGYSINNPKKKGGGGVRGTGWRWIWNFQGYQRNSMCNFWGWPRKNNVEFPGVFVFGLGISKGSNTILWNIQGLSFVLSEISRGKVNKWKIGLKNISSASPVWTFSGIAQYLIYYVKFNMWPALFYVNSLCFPNIFECWC